MAGPSLALHSGHCLLPVQKLPLALEGVEAQGRDALPPLNPTTLEALQRARPAQKASSPFSLPYLLAQLLYLGDLLPSLPLPPLLPTKSPPREAPLIGLPGLPPCQLGRGAVCCCPEGAPSAPGQKGRSVSHFAHQQATLADSVAPESKQGRPSSSTALPAPGSMTPGQGFSVCSPGTGASGRVVVDWTSAWVDAAGRGQKALSTLALLSGDCWIEAWPPLPGWPSLGGPRLPSAPQAHFPFLSVAEAPSRRNPPKCPPAPHKTSCLILHLLLARTHRGSPWPERAHSRPCHSRSPSFLLAARLYQGLRPRHVPSKAQGTG